MHAATNADHLNLSSSLIYIPEQPLSPAGTSCINLIHVLAVLAVHLVLWNIDNVPS